MSAGPVLSVRDVGKSFRVYPSRWAQLREILTGASTHRRHWVFQGLSFEVQRGESVGLVGRNGAGKSTLLKLLAGVAQPDTGHIERHGRIAAILELGVGFNGEFSGLENARQSLLLQGLDEAQAQALLPEVEAFAEVGEYFRQPVHTYSSGMQMRLAFSVVTAVRPDLLIVDYRLENGRNGVDAIVALRERFGATLPAIVVTGSTMSSLDKEAQEKDFHLLLKPVVPNKLRAMIAFKLNVKAS